MHSRLSTFWVFSSLVLLLLPVQADVIEPDTHYVERCVAFENAQGFSGVTFLAWVEEVTGGGSERYYVVQDGVCLEKGYKFNSLSIEWYDGNPLIRGMPVTRSGNSVVSERSDDFQVYGGYVDDSRSLDAENLTYRFVQQGQGYGAELSSWLKKNQGSDAWVETLPAAATPAIATVMPSVTQAPTASVQATLMPSTAVSSPTSTPLLPTSDWFSGVICFFKRLFGGSC